MTGILGLFVALVHIGLVLLAAPTLAGIIAWCEARLVGRAGPPVLQPWRDLRRLLRKQSILSDAASAITDLAPAACLAATAVAACLIPSFSLRTSLAPFEDLVVVAGLLAASRVALALIAMDAGTSAEGMGASRTMALACLAETALLMAAFSMAVHAGSLNLDAVAAMQRDTLSAWPAGVALALAATALLVLADGWSPWSAADVSGAELAAIETSAALRLVVWFDLVGSAFLPFGMADVGDGPLGWVVGLTCWLIRLLAFAGLLAAARAVSGRLRLRQAAQALGAAALIGLLATLVLLSGMGTA